MRESQHNKGICIEIKENNKRNKRGLYSRFIDIHLNIYRKDKIRTNHKDWFLY